MKTILYVASSFLFLCVPAQAYEVETGAVTICDTEQQVQRFAEVFEGSQQRAIAAVNTEEHDPNACGTVDAAYVLGPPIGMARSKSQAFQITEIVVVGLSTNSGYRPVNPARFFTPIKVWEVAV
jgi:hypothetical protein